MTTFTSLHDLSMWFWRGTQSAVVYYVSLAPCFEYNHKRKRRNEANRSQKERAELELSQPGLIHQPVPFQTNQYWAEEIEAGPGPPPGWKKHSLNDGVKRGKDRKRRGENGKKSVFSPAVQVTTNEVDFLTTSSSSNEESDTGGLRPATGSRRASAAGAGSAFDTFKDTIKSTIPRPDNWNWKRYEREDETLFGINDRISRMWDRATQHGRQLSIDRGRPLTPGRKKTPPCESDDYSWRYTRNPGVNDLHPPTVSQLPRTKREVAWIMQPPPSRAVMEGKVRPGSETTTRRPLCVIGGIPVNPKNSDIRQSTPERGSPGAPHRDQPPAIIISPIEREDTRAKSYPNHEATEEDTDDTSNVSSSDQDYLSSDHSFRQWSPSPSPRNSNAVSPQRSSSIRRPSLAVLIDSKSPTTIQSYQVPIPPPKPLNALSVSPLQQTSELDTWMRLVLPKLPERSRYSLPNVRLGEI